MEFNLMPWRKRQQKRMRQQAQAVMVFAILFSLSASVFMHLRVADQVQRLKFKIDTIQLSSTRKAEREHHATSSTFSMSALLNVLRQMSFYGMCINKLMITHSGLVINGYANQITGVVTFLDFARRHANLPSLQVTHIQNKRKQNLITFKLTANY